MYNKINYRFKHNCSSTVL